ncbi:CPBP family intramembrane metalloprotease [Rhizobium lemnae]|uniref:CPBP family intramembrane glutamic endopeptidase n=1 Tax=Rhizobium lemnae TaxID=1214924 RepID=A0ABV8E2F6_9HYPH|nr:CPBP family intramembrane glutamic endopeptidase [Rhizobium lemnae]MCJ8507563.1 CPBP family intramembrane metalloprotease [Rhizobium lemnae]
MIIQIQKAAENAILLLRMIVIDCAVPIVFIVIVTVVAETLGVFMGIILSGENFSLIVSQRGAHVTAGVVAYFAMLAACLIRLEAIKQSLRSPRSMIAAVAIGALWLAVNLLGQYGKPDVDLDTSLSAILRVLAGCALAPIAEETFWRGYLWARLKARGYGDGLITICTALLFAAVHLPNSLDALTNYLFMAFAFSLIRYFSGGIGLPIFFHAAMNFIVIRHIGV